MFCTTDALFAERNKTCLEKVGGENELIYRDGKNNYYLFLKAGKIKSVYRHVDRKNLNLKFCSVYYILEDGHTLHGGFQDKKNLCSVGDEVEIYAYLLVEESKYVDLEGNLGYLFVEEDKVVDLEHNFGLSFSTQLVKNINNQHHYESFSYVWADLPKMIIKSSINKIDGEKYLTVTLDDGTIWMFKSLHDSSHFKNWKIGEKVILLLHPQETESHHRHLNRQYFPSDVFSMININKMKASHYSSYIWGEIVIPLLPSK